MSEAKSKAPYIIGGAILALVGYSWWSSRQAQAAATTGAATQAPGSGSVGSTVKGVIDGASSVLSGLQSLGKKLSGSGASSAPQPDASSPLVYKVPVPTGASDPFFANGADALNGIKTRARWRLRTASTPTYSDSTADLNTVGIF